MSAENTANLNSKIKEIRGGPDYITAAYENGYTARIYGELQPGAKFTAYIKYFKSWLPPHENEPLTFEMAKKLVDDVLAENGPGKVCITFEGQISVK